MIPAARLMAKLRPRSLEGRSDPRDVLARRVLRRYERECDDVQRRRKQVIDRLAGSAAHDDRDLRAGFTRLARLAERARVLEALRPRERPVGPTITICSWTLRRSYEICTATPDEGMHFIVGVRLDGMDVGTEIVEFPYALRSVASAAGEGQATHRICIEAVETGHRVLAILHSHPGTGPDSNYPSRTDLRTHALWERAGSIVGGIWSRDGFLRWFHSQHPVNVEMVGDHLEQLDANLWRLRDEYIT